MACRNLCEKLDSPTKVSKSYYADGKKYCRRCEIDLHHSGTFCPCCGMALRVTPTARKDKEVTREINRMNKATYHHLESLSRLSGLIRPAMVITITFSLLSCRPQTRTLFIFFWRRCVVLLLALAVPGFKRRRRSILP
jgi:hypothetical protein